jgi:hypothetical protein
MIYLEVLDRDGGTIRDEEYETVEELLREWPWAEENRGYWTVWVGSKE